MQPRRASFQVPDRLPASLTHVADNGLASSSYSPYDDPAGRPIGNQALVDAVALPEGNPRSRRHLATDRLGRSGPERMVRSRFLVEIPAHADSRRIWVTRPTARTTVLRPTLRARWEARGAGCRSEQISTPSIASRRGSNPQFQITWRENQFHHAKADGLPYPLGRGRQLVHLGIQHVDGKRHVPGLRHGKTKIVGNADARRWFPRKGARPVGHASGTPPTPTWFGVMPSQGPCSTKRHLRTVLSRPWPGVRSRLCTIDHDHSARAGPIAGNCVGMLEGA